MILEQSNYQSDIRTCWNLGTCLVLGDSWYLLQVYKVYLTSYQQ